MPRYTIQDRISGKTVTFDWNGADPPTESDMDEVFAQASMHTSDEMPEWKRTVSSIARPVLEGAGMIGGGILGASGGAIGGTAAIPGAGTVAGGLAGGTAGAALGNAAGGEVADLLDEYLGVAKPKSLGENLMEAGGRTIEGAGAHMVGMSLGPMLQKLWSLRKIVSPSTEAAKSLYESALKPPTNKNWTIERRDRALTTGLNEAVSGGPYMPVREHVDALKDKVYDLVQQADDIVLSQSNMGGKIKINKIVQAIDDVAEEFKKGPFPHKDLKMLDELKEELLSKFRKGPGKFPRDLTIEEGLEMKKRIYKIAEKYYQNQSYNDAIAKIEAEKAIARTLKEELEKFSPEAGKLYGKASRLIDFGEVLERAANRIGNREVFSLFDFLGGNVGAAVAGGPGAVAAGSATMVARNPKIRAWLAKIIMEANIPKAVKADLTKQIGKLQITGALGAKYFGQMPTLSQSTSER